MLHDVRKALLKNAIEQSVGLWCEEGVDLVKIRRDPNIADLCDLRR